MEQPRLENGEALLVAGLCGRYNRGDVAGIPAQWRRLGPHMGRIPGQVGGATYGVCCRFDAEGNFDYICGVEVDGPGQLPEELSRIRLAPQRYAVFTHSGHISAIKSTWEAIFRDWLPKSGYLPLDAPQFERYGESFDPGSGTGSVEIWIPIRA